MSEFPDDGFPDAGKHKNEIIRNTKTGQSYKSDGEKWYPIEANSFTLKTGAGPNKYAFAVLLNYNGFDPYIVVGVGRSGTSTVADILHNKLNVCMGNNFGGEWNKQSSKPNGFWEDLDFSVASRGFVLGKINLDSWMDHVLLMAAQRKQRSRAWGFKDTRICYLLGFYLGIFQKPRLVYCKRDKDVVIRSLMKCYEFSDQESIMLYDQRTMLLDNAFSQINTDSLVIDFGKRRVPDKEIIKQLQDKWEDLKCI